MGPRTPAGPGEKSEKNSPWEKRAEVLRSFVFLHKNRKFCEDKNGKGPSLGRLCGPHGAQWAVCPVQGPVLTQTGARTAGKSAGTGPQVPEAEVHRACLAPTAPKRQARRDPRGGGIFRGGKVIFGILTGGAGFGSPNSSGTRRKK